MTLLMLIAAAAAVGTAEAPEAAPVKKDADKIVCKSERFVGSHVSERICKPKSEWETGRKNAKDALNKMKMVNVAKRGEGGDAMPASPSQKGPMPR